MRTTWLPLISALNEQPTPQYAHVVTTARSGCPSWYTEFSMSVAVGHACTQAPQETHSEFMKLSICPGEIWEANPRPSIVSAKVPWVSSQARTQRLQTMHLLGSKVK